MFAKDIRPGMIIRDGKLDLRVLDTPFPCSLYTKTHVKVERSTKDGAKVETYCYDRMAEVNVRA